MTEQIPAPDAWRQWRDSRDAAFADPYGWLSLTALVWLDGEPTRYDGLPGRWWADADGFHVETDAAEPPLRVDGSALDRPAGDGSAPVWDGTGEPPRVTHGERRLELMVRGLGRKGVRVRDPQAPALRAFTGVPAFDYDPAWRITGEYRPYDAARTVQVAAVVPGLQHAQALAGEVSFRVDGASHTLVVNDGDWIAFRDASNGVQTTRHCRWLDVEPATDGTVVLDFNLSANPPCAFSDFGTCPLPPDGNDLAVAVLAGERNPRAGG